MPTESDTVIDRVRRALGRAEMLKTLPVPPPIPDPVARLLSAGADLPATFERQALAQKMLTSSVAEGDLMPQMVDFLRERQSKRVMLSDTPLLNRLGAADYLNANGFTARSWRDMTADDTYDYDAGVTEVDYAVAETGTVAIRHRREHGRLLSLVPFVHVAVVQPHQLVPDLLDLFDALHRDGTGSGVTLISGPSKTADIEMNVVTGVHGPNVVRAFVLR